MHRDIDPRSDDLERAELARGGRGPAEDVRPSLADDPRDVFSRDLDLPRGSSRERVRVSSREYTMRGSEARTLATVGAFRVVPADDLRQPGERESVLRKDLDRLRDIGLIQTMPEVVGDERRIAVSLTSNGRDLLEAARRDRESAAPQAFYTGRSQNRELGHDLRLYRAYLDAAERLRASGHRIRRVVLDRELKRDYQSFLQAPNRGCRQSSGRPRRDRDAIGRWAQEHQLPVVDDRVRFPDVRIEYDDRDGRRQVEDVEVMTPNYRGAHLAAKVSAGFARVGASSGRVGGAQTSARGGRAADLRLAEEMLG